MPKDLEHYLNLDYEIRVKQIRQEDGGGWLAEIPLLPGCMSDGETPAEAITNIEDAKRCWIETCLALGREVPEPAPEDFSGQLRIRMPKSLHKILSERAKEENISLNQFIIYQLARTVGHKT